MERFCKYVSSEYTNNSHWKGQVPQIIDYSAKGCQPSEAWKDINCLCILRILSTVRDFTYLTLLLLLKSWQAQSRASRLATYPSGSSPIFPFSCQETWRGVNHSCNPVVASRRNQENFSGRGLVHQTSPFIHFSLHIWNKSLGEFTSEKGERGMIRCDLGTGDHQKFPWKGVYKYIT